ncbi:RcnB family protein [Paracoccus sp. SSK6]|uniref:RcnB family protein n=1 Tax=Paracoccus sp. SSK6 TaxID=3143131 RepID=UPI00321C3577
MKRLLLSTLTAVPAFAEAREAPRCERPADRLGALRQDRRPNCPARLKADRHQTDRGRHDSRRAAAHQAPQEERRAQPRRDWRPGDTYRGKGQRIDHRRADPPAPARGQHWIREGDRYLLVTDGGGIIRSVMRHALR